MKIGESTSFLPSGYRGLLALPLSGGGLVSSIKGASDHDANRQSNASHKLEAKKDTPVKGLSKLERGD